MFYAFNYQEVNKDYQNTQPHCNVSIAGNIINALADTGAQATAMSAQKFAMIFGKTKFNEIKIPTGKSFRGAGGNLLPNGWMLRTDYRTLKWTTMAVI